MIKSISPHANEKSIFRKEGSATPAACTAWPFSHVKDIFSNPCFFSKLLQDISKKGSATPAACTAWPFPHVKDVFSNLCFFCKLLQGINKRRSFAPSRRLTYLTHPTHLTQLNRPPGRRRQIFKERTT